MQGVNKFIPRSKDARVKLSLEDREIIRKRYLDPFDQCSTRSLARDYGVSRRTITFILDPHKRLQNVDRRRERIARGEQPTYYSDRGALYMRRYRRRLRKINPEAAKELKRQDRERARRKKVSDAQ